MARLSLGLGGGPLGFPSSTVKTHLSEFEDGIGFIQQFLNRAASHPAGRKER